MKYYIAVNGQSVGPFEDYDLIANGCTAQSMVWTEGMAAWTPAGQVPALAQFFAAPQQPAQPAYQPPVQQPAYQQPAYQQPAYQQYGYAGAGGQQPDMGAANPKVEQWLMLNNGNFPPERMGEIRARLNACDDNKLSSLSMLSFKNPTTMLIISLFLGGLGVDRFMLGDTGLGIAKLLTAGGCGIWTIIDWVTVMNKTREVNYNQLMQQI